MQTNPLTTPILERVWQLLELWARASFVCYSRRADLWHLAFDHLSLPETSYVYKTATRHYGLFSSCRLAVSHCASVVELPRHPNFSAHSVYSRSSPCPGLFSSLTIWYSVCSFIVVVGVFLALSRSRATVSTVLRGRVPSITRATTA
ncbi:hypothetical protein EXIGLDRAFT_303510 [Exidia glandulosa HHB12029]|uniref:Uncharacterized protein n=1 Tax=Exidia glandulosa HHB12029 TaxID=1314781 RepID=A0A165D6E9_EXIGL|nr:hypothetical protein EXIGLDRAFT_303510 [Exidia glandulosa HHB12029]